MQPIKVGFIDEMIEEMASGIYDFTVDGKCSNCGSCCSDFLPVSEKEIKRIKKYMKQHNITEQKHFVPSANPVIDMTCPFRNNSEKKCVIYEVRPMICREWQCNKPHDGIGPDPTIYQQARLPISMRQTFFQEKSS